jgi:hemerythrin superfamily protein
MPKRSSTAQANAIDMLMEDHRNVETLFAAFENADREDEEECQRIAETACAELRIHSMLEQEVFYPAVRGEADEEEEDLLNEAEVEHASIEELIDKLDGMDAGDPMYAAHFTVLTEYVKHHVKEEEDEMFPKVRKMKGLDLDELGTEMRERREALIAEAGMEADDLDEEEEISDESEESTAAVEEEAPARRTRRN